MYRKTRLANGISVVTERMPSVRSVSTGIWVNVGSRDEGEPEQGITHFIEHMLFKGTERRTALDIAKELDGVGGFANAFTSKDNVCFHAKVLHNHLPLVVDLLSDIFLHSVIAEDELDRERQVILQEINMVEDVPEELVHILFHQTFWKGNPLGVPIYGTLDSVRGLSRDGILGYIGRAFRPSRIVVAAAGNVDHEKFVSLWAPKLETLDGAPELPPRLPPAPHLELSVVERDIEQVHLVLGLPGCSQRDEGRFACHVLNAVLGGSMSSRLFQEVREKRGLAYSVYSFLDSHEDTGLLGVYAAVAPENLEETLDVVGREIRRLAEEPIPRAEFAAAREYLKGSMYLNAESTDSRMNRIAKNEFLFERFVPYKETERRISSVTREGLHAWFREALGGKPPALVALGPVAEDRVAGAFRGLV